MTGNPRVTDAGELPLMTQVPLVGLKAYGLYRMCMCARVAFMCVVYVDGLHACGL